MGFSHHAKGKRIHHFGFRVSLPRPYFFFYFFWEELTDIIDGIE